MNKSSASKYLFEGQLQRRAMRAHRERGDLIVEMVIDEATPFSKEERPQGGH